MTEVVVNATGNRPIGKKRCKALAACLPQGMVPPDIEINLLLAGKGSGGKILRSRRTPNGNIDLIAVLFTEPVIGGLYFGPEFIRDTGT